MLRAIAPPKLNCFRPKPYWVEEWPTDMISRCHCKTLPMRKGDRMSSNGIALAATVILLFPMGYFLLASPAFLLVKLDIPPVTQLLRGLFNAHFLMVSIAGTIGTLAFLVAGRLAFAVGIGLIAAFAVWARRWFLRQWDAQLNARDAGDADAVRRLRRLHWGGMLSNAMLLATIVGSIPYIAISA
jgi:hypothetical protein